MTTFELVTVVIPVYNGSRYLREAIDSVLSQTYGNVEIVAVDDGSTDSSPEILASYGDRVHLFRQKNCGNVGQVRNAGMERAQGEFIAFLDQDDWWRPEKLERQVAVMRSDARIGLVHTKANHVDETGTREVPRLACVRQQLRLQGDCFEQLLLGNSIYNSSVMVRKSALDDVGLCDLDVPGNTVQDYNLWLRIAAKYRLGLVEEPLISYRVHAGQGMWRRPTILRAELEMLLRIRPDSDWLRSQSGRARLANLYDQLAVAYLDQGKVPEARRYFWEALRRRRSLRHLARFLASRLPARFIDAVRSKRQSNPGSPISNTPSPELVISR